MQQSPTSLVEIYHRYMVPGACSTLQQLHAAAGFERGHAPGPRRQLPPRATARARRARRPQPAVRVRRLLATGASTRAAPPRLPMHRLRQGLPGACAEFGRRLLDWQGSSASLCVLQALCLLAAWMC